ncbi:MAG: TrbC family F-type conjugative pilus assembly protein, partial [Conexivisphaerales archaeon]
MWVGFLSSLVMYNPIQLADKRMALIEMGACIFGSIIPDIDVKWSANRTSYFRFTGDKMNRNNYKPQKHTLLNAHRGWTHHIFLPIILVLIGLFLNGFYQQVLFAFTFGVIIHIATDMFSPMGIPLLGNNTRVSLPLYKTGKISEFFFVSAISAVLFFFTPYKSFAYQNYFDNNTMLQQDYQKALQFKQQEEAIKNDKKFQEQLKQHILIYQNNKITQKANDLANKSMQAFRSRQKEIQQTMADFEKQNNISIANLMPIQNHQVLASNSYIYIFMSSSVPFEVWRNYAFAINKLRHDGQGNIALVLRGCIGGCVKVMPTILFIQKVLTYGNTKLLVPVIIDPYLFDMYKINRVPVFVYAKNVNTINPQVTAGA